VRLGEDRGRHHGLAEEPADLLFVGVAGSAPEPLGKLPGEAVELAANLVAVAAAPPRIDATLKAA